MSLFLTNVEREFIDRERASGVASRLFGSMQARVRRRAESPGLLCRDDSVEWWHVAEEAVSCAAIIYAITPEPLLGAWLSNVTLGIVRRPISEWIGPWFRNHARKPEAASLETAHLTRAVAAAIDLGSTAFTSAEIEEIRQCLRERAVPMASEYLDGERELHNYFAIVTSGLAFAAAVLNDRPSMQKAAAAYNLFCDAYQPDGTYAESLQYANYASTQMMLTYEALVRCDPSMAKHLRPAPYLGVAVWAAYAHLFNAPLPRWGNQPRPQSINFGDSGALFVPSAELLLHIAGYGRSLDPRSAKLARWLYDVAIDGLPSAAPFDRASFAFVNQPGFLSLPLLAHAGLGQSPAQLELPAVQAFDAGDVIARDAWDGKTVVAVRTGGCAMNVVSHLHGDLNSLIVVHNDERLLVDAGHSCYRNVTREIEIAARTHNTCTFRVPAEVADREQQGIANRALAWTGLGQPRSAMSKRLLVASDGELRVTVSDAAERYGDPIERFVRVCVLCGSNVVFVIDRIISAVPVITQWNWHLDNRDGLGELQVPQSDRIVFRRPKAAMQMWSQSQTGFSGPQYTQVHDAYHPLPNQLGEGAIGTGLLVRWRERDANADRGPIHAIALDRPDKIDAWSFSRASDGTLSITHATDALWSVKLQDGQSQILICGPNQAWTIEDNGHAAWRFTKR